MAAVLVESCVLLDLITAEPRWEAWSAEHLYDYRPLPREAAFLAARAHADYRERGGKRATIVPDFLIGAHAVIEQVPLLTRDVRRYRQAFPGLKLIAPA